MFKLIISYLPKMLPVMKFSIPLWAVLLIMLPLTANLMISQSRLNNAYAKLGEYKAEMDIIKARLVTLSKHSDFIEQQAKENEEICNARLADRERIKQILKPVAKKPASPKPILPQSPEKKDEAEVNGEQATLPEIIPTEVSAEVVRFINAHLAH